MYIQWNVCISSKALYTIMLLRSIKPTQAFSIDSKPHHQENVQIVPPGNGRRHFRDVPLTMLSWMKDFVVGIPRAPECRKGFYMTYKFHKTCLLLISVIVRSQFTYVGGCGGRLVDNVPVVRSSYLKSNDNAICIVWYMERGNEQLAKHATCKRPP